MAQPNHTTKSGSRHNAEDRAHGAQALDHLDKAKDHLQQAGFGADDAPKSMMLVRQMLAAAKAVPACWDAGQYAVSEGWDAATAFSLIQPLNQLLASEISENDADGIALLQAAITSLSKFGMGELADQNEAIAQDAENEAAAQAAAMGAMPNMLSLNDALVFQGTEVKALGDGLVGGYLVRYGDEKKTDLTGDFFTDKTNFGDAAESIVFYNHGLDPTLGKKQFKNKAALGTDKIGKWIKHQLDLRDEYEKATYGLAEQKKLGWSSGTVGHIVERERVGSAMWIKTWLLGLDASYTPTPAERLNEAIPLKAFVDSLPGRTAAPNGAHDAPTESPVSGKPKQEIKTMADATATAPPAISPEMQAMFDKIMGAVGEVKKVQDEMKNAAPVHETGTIPNSAAKTAEILAAQTAPATVHTETLHEKYADEQINALKAYMAKEMGVDDWRKHVRKMREADSKVADAWKSFVRAPVDPYKRHEYEQAIKASLVEGTASLGGDLVPIIYSNQVVSNLITDSVVRKSGATIVPVSGTNTFQVPTLTRSGSAPIASEMSAASQMEPTIGHQNFTAYAYRAQYIASREEMLDSRIPLDSLLVDNASWQLVQSENNHFVVGTGASQPQGIAVAASLISASPGSTIALAFASASGADNIVTLYHSLPYQYRDTAVWFANDATIAQIRKIRVGSNAASLGDYIWQPGLQSGSPDRLLGRPIYTANNMTTSGSAAGSLQSCLVFCDPRFFWIADFNNGGMNFQVLNELYAASAAVGWWFWKRMDSHLLVAEAAQGLALR